MKTSTLFGTFTAGLLVLMAIPMVMLLALNMSGPEWYWADTGNVFTDWSIWYTVFLPFYIIAFATAFISRKHLKFRIAKNEIFFWLFAWGFYDWCWQAIVGMVQPPWSWTAIYYFDIWWHPTQYWLFFVAAMAGLGMGVYEMRVAKKPKQLLPFLLWLAWVYGMGGVTQVIHVDWTTWLVYDIIMALAVSAAFKSTIW